MGFGALWLALCLKGAAFGQTPLSWTEAVEEASRANPGLQSATAAAEAARDAWKVTWGAYFPTVSGILQQERSEILFPDASLDAGQSIVHRVGPEANWNIFSLSSIGATKQSYHAYRSALAIQRRVSADLRLSLHSAFGQLIFQQRNVELLRSIAAKLRSDADFVKIEYQSGVGARWNYLEADAQAQEAEWEVFQALSQTRSSRQQLASLLGRSTMEELTVSGGLDVPSPPDAPEPYVAKALQDSPEVRFQAEQVDVSKGARLSAVGAFTPTATASFLYLWQDTQWPPQTRNWDLTAGVSLPLFAGGANVEALKQAKAAVKQQEKSLADVRNTLKASVEDAYAAYRAADARLKAVRAEVAAEAEREETLRAEYKAGRASYFEWNSAVTQHVAFEKQELQSMLDAYNAFGAWERSLGIGVLP